MIGIIIFDDVDLLDVTGPKEVFGAVRDPISNPDLDPIEILYSSESLIQVKLVSTHEVDFITTADGTKIIPDLDLLSVEDKFDGWVIPGGKGAQTVRKDIETVNRIRELLSGTNHNLSVCTGAYISVETGLFDGQEITTHHRHFDLFEKLYPNIHLNRKVRYIELESIVFASGVSAGIEGALKIVSNLFDEQRAEQVRNVINYPLMT